MHKHILIPTDGSELSRKAIQYGIALAKSVNAHVTGITVSAPFHAFAAEDLLSDSPELYRKRRVVATAKYLDEVKQTAAEAGVRCEVKHAEHEYPYKAILEAANDRACDLIVMASHGRRGLSAIVLGSETVKVLTHSNIPVLVYRDTAPILFPQYFAAS